MTSLIDQFAQHGILITSNRQFTFNGTEEQFKQALEYVMDGYGYTLQDENWFPGNPSGDGDMYYLEDTEDDLYMAFDWVNKEFHLT